MGNNACRTLHTLTAMVGVAVVAISPWFATQVFGANALHRYTFNDGTIDDSIGTAHGTLMDPAGIAAFNAGRLDLTANNGAAANVEPIVNGAWVELPDGLFTNSVTAGVNGAISIEAWVNVQQNFTNSRIWSFGDSLPGGGFSNWGEMTDWVDLNSQNGNGNLALTTHELGQMFDVNELEYSGTLPTGTRHHVVSTFDQNDSMGGANPDGTMRLYVNNVEIGTFAISPFLPLGLINDVNNYLGRSQWPDPFFDGQIDEITIYDDVLSPAEVNTNFATGPVPTPIPTFVIDRDTGDIRIENQTPINFNLVSYSITSAAGALDADGWVPIADDGDANNGGGFDSSGIWNVTTSTANELAEGTVGNGGQVAATTGSWNLGPAWVRSPTEDLQAMFELSDDSTGIADVSFLGNGGAPFGRSDLNADGSVNVADWTIFLANSDTAFPGVTSVEAHLTGDLDGDFDNDFRDFRLFQIDFVAENGAAAFAALLAGDVPEPTSSILLALGILALTFAARRRPAAAAAATLLFVCLTVGSAATAATPVLYVASDDPGLAPDANAGADDVWTTTLGPTGGSGSFLGFGELGIGDAWALFSYPIDAVIGTIDADHTFAGGALTVGQSVRLDFANSAIAAGGSVGVSLTSGGTPVATFKYNGDDPEGIYRYDDAGGTDQPTAEPFAYRTPAHLEFGINSSNSYTAAYGLSSWSGTYSGAIDGIRVFNNMGGDGSDAIFNNLEIGTTSLVPLTLEVNKSSGDVTIKGHETLAANIDFYQINSAGAALDPVLWNSLDEQNVFAVDGDDPGDMAGDSPGEGWDVSDNASDGSLTEYFLRAGGVTLASNTDLSLGKAYDNSVFGAADGDLLFTYGLAGGAQLSGSVKYVTGSTGDLIGDYNDDGVVNAADYVVWRNNDGTMFDLPNRDPVNNGAVGPDDYVSWVNHFGDSSGAGAVSTTQSVPEPASALLFAVSLLVSLQSRCHRDSAVRCAVH